MHNNSKENKQEQQKLTLNMKIYYKQQKPTDRQQQLKDIQQKPTIRQQKLKRRQARTTEAHPKHENILQTAEAPRQTTTAQR